MRRTASRVAFLALMIPGPLAAFTLTKEQVFPRVFTPNGDGVNDVVYFNVATSSLDTMEGKVYDAEGLPVADMTPALSGAVQPLGPLSPDALMWDGKDRNGNVVRAGVYIYEVRNGNGQSFTGTVVVAK